MKLLRSFVQAPLRGALSSLGNYRLINSNAIDFIVEPKNWSIRDDGIQISNEINNYDNGMHMRVTSKPYFSKASVMHFGSQFMFQNWVNHLPENRKIVVTYFHGKVSDGSLIRKNLEFLIKNQNRVDSVVVSFHQMSKRLIEMGLNPSLITQIPIGVSTSLFTPPISQEQVVEIRRYGIPKNFFVVGSFQKDGEGWKDGLTPKLIKGPDIFVDVIRKLSRELPIFVLLSGPARGYVKQRLEEIRVPFAHYFLKKNIELVRLYQALDLYVIPSREEGGPKGLLESLAVGCPVVSTPVGMATDMSLDGRFTSMTSNFESNQIFDASIRILNETLEYGSREQLRSKVLEFDWRIVARKHFDRVYKPLTVENVDPGFDLG